MGNFLFLLISSSSSPSQEELDISEVDVTDLGCFDKDEDVLQPPERYADFSVFNGKLLCNQ
eukprot:maker-scaffold_69-snap-gene-0.44-mRNA-1 protein AED:0.62 eAED:0.90 QI:0/0/0/1/0/0/2/0/60